jgi:NAD(P)-dependent dehydrogenase (short-subunit alcohol dehydrogenase family)
MEKTAIVTGAASGVGQAVALRLLEQGWRVAVVGRSVERLGETLRLAGTRAKSMVLIPCDISDPAAVREAGAQALRDLGKVDVLVNSAGTNVPKRSLEELSLDDYRKMMSSNLDGAYYWVQAVLPQMRKQQAGTIVNIVSDAGKLASPKAGPAYVMSKFGMAGLTQSINAEERARGIRACAIFPGDINTPLLEKRPAPPDASARERMLRPEDVAECVMLCINMPHHAIVEELMVRPR